MSTLEAPFSLLSGRIDFKLSMVNIRTESFRLTPKSLKSVICAKSAFLHFCQKNDNFLKSWKFFHHGSSLDLSCQKNPTL